MPARTASSQAPCKAEKKIVKFAEMAVKKAEDANKIKPYKKALKAEEQAKQEYEDCTSSVVIAEPVGTKQPHPFAPPSVGKQLAVDEPISPVAVTEPTTVTGNEPGLYGGSSDYPSCDKEQLKAFLTGAPTLDRKPAGPGGNDIQYTPEQQAENRRKGKAWAEGLGPVSFPKGTLPHVITPDEIAGYIDTLTSFNLRSDTAVTNNGYSNGKPTPHQSVLQAGWGVLVDEYGVPRTKCYCGNSLRPPEYTPPYTTTTTTLPPITTTTTLPPTTTTRYPKDTTTTTRYPYDNTTTTTYPYDDTPPKFYGCDWPGCSPKHTTYITESPTPIESFVYTGPDGMLYLRPAGSDGTWDMPYREAPTQPTPAPKKKNYPTQTTTTTEPQYTTTTTTKPQYTTTTTDQSCYEDPPGSGKVVCP